MISVIARIVTMVLIFFQQAYDWSSKTTEELVTIPEGTNLSQMPLTGLVLARGGSRGIRNKNMVQLHNLPLIHWTLGAMIKSGVFSEIWVSTDDESIRKYSLKLGVKVHDRAAFTATDEASSMIAVQEFIETQSECKHCHIIALVQCTSPFIQPKYLQEAAERMATGNCDAVFSVTRTHQLRWSIASNDDYAAKPLNFDPKSRPRRQNWKGELVENGMFYFSHRHLIEKGVFQNHRSCVVEIPKNHSLEIDTEDDLVQAEIMMQRLYPSPLRDVSDL